MATANSVPLLDGKGRNAFVAILSIILALMTIDGLQTWVAAEDARDVIGGIEERDGEVDDRGLILNDDQRTEIAAQTNGDRLDRGLLNTKFWLAVTVTIAGALLIVSAGPGSSRRVLTTSIVIAMASWFGPLILYAKFVDVVTTAHGG